MGTRLTKRDAVTVSVYRTSKTDSGYVGHTEEESLIGTVQALVTPVTDELSAEMYGDRINKMKEFTLLKGADIHYGDKLVVDGEKYRVIARPEYIDNIVVKGELE
ncbi:MAG: hypothetical protein IJ561_02235 [Ruminococcus sp.]|nr:hypothetical protein [Ruminococcus sp.]